MTAPDLPSRIAFVDYGKGISIILVVMMHSVLGLEAALGGEGWLHAVVEVARPFRIPAFFLLAGLFLSRSIEGDWRGFLDRKVLHFAYFYALWLTIQFAFKLPVMAKAQGLAPALASYAEAYVQPFGTLWFIYLLPVFFLAARLTRSLPPLLVWCVAAALEIAPVQTGMVVIDEFAARFVYFYSGYLFARGVFALARGTERNAAPALAALVVWAPVTGVCAARGWADLPGVSLLLGMAGAAAIVAVSALLACGDRARWLRLCGQNSLVIYLAFFLPMVAMRETLVHAAPEADIGTLSLIVTVTAVALPLLMARLVRGTRLGFLFERPQALRLNARMRLAPQR